MIWKYIKPLKDLDSVDKFLDKYNIELPDDLVKCIKCNNGGRPSEKLFDTDMGKEYVFKSLLSYNEGDSECITKVYPKLFEGTKLYPIGSDASGNFVCFDCEKRKYVLLKHETNSIEVIMPERKV